MDHKVKRILAKVQLAGDRSGHDFQLLAPTGTTVFLREAARMLSGGKARGFPRNKISTYRWSRVSNLSFLARCPRISSISLEREQRSPPHECLQEDLQELGEEKYKSFRPFMYRGKNVPQTYSAASVSFRARASSTTSVTRSTLGGEKQKR